MKMDKELDEKLYRVVKKKDSHINTKINPDGSKAAIQFTDNGNDLSGPLDIIEVDESEFVRTEYVTTKDKARTLPEILWQDVIAPIAKEALYQALMTGYNNLSKQVKTKEVPKIKQKFSGIVEDISIVASGIRDGLAGKETKASRLLKENVEVLQPEIVCSEPKNNEQEKVIRTEEEVINIINAMKCSAVTLAACIRMLNNSAIADDGSNPEIRIEIQRNLQALSTQDVMSQIELLLEDKNRTLLDDASISLLSAFKKGYLIADDRRIPIAQYMD